MRSKNFFLPVFFQFKMHRKCIFCAYTDRKADIHPFSYAKTSLDYPNLKTYQSGKQIKYKQKESKIPNSITQRKKTVSDNRILQAKESSENLFKIRGSNGELHPWTGDKNDVVPVTKKLRFCKESELSRCVRDSNP